MFIILALILAGSLQASAPNLAVEKFVDVEWPASGAPGFAYAIVDQGEIRSNVRGVVLAGADEAVTPDTPFLIGSITKSFTALAIMQLAEQGQIDLDARIDSYLDPFTGRASGTVTVRQLLSHTSGYSTVQGNALHSDRTARTGELGEHVVSIAQWDTVHTPGTVWEYSNANYQVLGALIEEMSGEDYATYVESKILAPLQMGHSSVFGGGSAGRVATGHRPWFGGHQQYNADITERANAPAGGIISSANDMAAYLAMMVNGEDDIISAASKAEMVRPASNASPFYGLGWFINTEAGTAFHGGLMPGTETLATILPSERKGVVVLVNANGGIGFGENLQLRNGVTAKALDLEYSGEGSRLWPKFTYLLVMLLPLFFMTSIVWAWFARKKLAAKSGVLGLFSLWLPLVAMFVLAGVLMFVVPNLFGGSLGTLLLYQPDFTTAMVSAAITAPLWATFRLVVAYRERSGPR
ncbi:serine hydrolase domain-containing protein [Allopontixanthobacter sediminis]|uniref:serine hydrolase domain-containing protein n=1 Tax=Allopontixanthobacter sediminis TaxID=1689985 RepID=UPI001926C74F|nr:serine hydrolase domain-containing protein [Allopontixanthobacter sediminis]